MVLRRRRWAIATALLASVLLGVYLALITGEADDSLGEVLPWATLMGVAVLLPVASLTLQPRGARLAMTAATVLLGLLGVISIASIGLGFLLAAALAWAAVIEARRLESPSADG